MKYHEIKIIPHNADVQSLADALTAVGFDAFELSDSGLPEPGGWDYIDDTLKAQTSAPPFIRNLSRKRGFFSGSVCPAETPQYTIGADSDEKVDFEESVRDEKRMERCLEIIFQAI